jgi:LmbE family N-acetylglucosaminyl deacetylase
MLTISFRKDGSTVSPHENKDDAERFLSKRHKTILIVAHQDDDVIGAGCFLQNHASVQVSYCTDGGAPMNVPIWRRLGLSERSQYVELRNKEASAALKLSGAQFGVEFHLKTDGSLYEALRLTANEIRQTVNSTRPDFVLTHTFEHGHPDHDCCSFLSAQIGAEFRIPVFEMPIYGRHTNGSELIQQFEKDEELLRITPTAEQIALKKSMLNAHESQRRLGNLNMFRADIPETFRRQPNYAFDQAPTWRYNVETALPEQVWKAFGQFMAHNKKA